MMNKIQKNTCTTETMSVLPGIGFVSKCVYEHELPAVASIVGNSSCESLHGRDRKRKRHGEKMSFGLEHRSQKTL